MVWIIQDEDEERFVEELHSYPDRVAGLLGQSIVERRLLAVIKKLWRDTDKIFEHLFQDSGPLGTFSAQIQVGFAIELYGRDAYRDLDRIRRIRNEFAHKLGAKHFNSQKIRDLASGLVLPGLYPISKEAVIYTPTNYEGYFIWDEVPATLKHSFLSGEATDPRSKFLRCVEILAAFLWFEDYFARNVGMPKNAVPPPPRF